MLIWLVVRSLVHKTLLVQPQVSPGQSNAVALTSTLRNVRLPVSGPPSTSGYPREVTCPATLLRVQPHVSHVSSTRSVTSPSGFPQGLLNNLGLAPSSRSLRLGCTLPGVCSLRRRPCHPTALLCRCSFLPHAIRCKTLCTHGQYQSQSGVHTW